MATDTQRGTDGTAPTEPVQIESADHLDELVADQDVVLVDFYADWCGPCQMMEPGIETLAEESDATVAKVDVDALQQLASAYGVRGVPTTVLFAGGEQVDQHVGMLSEEQLFNLVSQYTDE
ncbi:thioredoxin [Natranaeroarchaeum aerophilus]|uniref:Thioredoxin n=1 Tax=Natranaeroarchaeum aerophilus TaxID=2917711 RepID=A0AAE3FSR4_9EURY|nr:thioredoxin [Natranaeroarchaeum aerophilus]MCL9814531.1 thioredoxin [Natranaeroarchaeum aerophilus]